MVRLNQDSQDERLGCDAQSTGTQFWACCLLFPLILLSPSGDPGEREQKLSEYTALATSR